MDGWLALHPKILGRLHNAGAEEHLPSAVDRHAGGKRIRGIDQPPREPQAVVGRTLRERRKPGRHARLDPLARFVVLAALKNERVPPLRQFLHDHRQHDRAVGLVQRLPRGVEFLDQRLPIR
jgi:hypothetical protein